MKILQMEICLNMFLDQGLAAFESQSSKENAKKKKKGC